MGRRLGATTSTPYILIKISEEFSELNLGELLIITQNTAFMMEKKSKFNVFSLAKRKGENLGYKLKSFCNYSREYQPGGNLRNAYFTYNKNNVIKDLNIISGIIKLANLGGEKSATFDLN